MTLRTNWVFIISSIKKQTGKKIKQLKQFFFLFFFVNKMPLLPHLRSVHFVDSTKHTEIAEKERKYAFINLRSTQ